MNRRLMMACLLVLTSAAQADVTTDLPNWFLANAEKQSMAETVVVTPGYKMLLGGKSVPVFGDQPCARVDGSRLQGANCLVIDKDTASVQAQFVLDGKMATEVWTVERPSPDRTLLRRPNGDYVVRAN